MVAQLVRKKKDFSTFSNISANGNDDDDDDDDDNDDSDDDDSYDDDRNDIYGIWDDSRPPQLFSAFLDSLLL